MMNVNAKRMGKAGMRAKTIMVQGTMSGVGKSTVCAGLCRLFAQEGLSVAPFKAQNMALNSGIAADGAEIGRAQIAQAEAAGVEPEAAMNPVLLKPSSDTRSQVIVHGRPHATLSAREYGAQKLALVPLVLEAYESLARRFDVVVVEGAGSPAEVNLKERDIANMALAKAVRSPVVLVGDIDRGGVFAQLIGTMMLLDADERALVRGLVVNKFRGDPQILASGLDILEERCSVPVLGTIPYEDFGLEEEDSLAERLSGRGFSLNLPDASSAIGHPRSPALDVAVIRLPRISNFTDADALAAVEGVRVRFVDHASDLGAVDLIVIPGTKSTLADLAWLKERGLADEICRRARAGVFVLGICGGYQMLGRSICDEAGVEGGGVADGLGLLPVATVFSRCEGDKVRARVSGRVRALEGPFARMSGTSLSGYLVHMGMTQRLGGAAFADLAFQGELHAFGLGGARGPVDGATGEDGCCAGSVCGTYVHGALDAPSVCQALIDALSLAKGLPAGSFRARDRAADKEEAYDRIAAVLRASLDVDALHRIVEEGVS